MLWVAGVTLEDPRTEDLSQEVRGFIFSKILVCKMSPLFLFGVDSPKLRCTLGNSQSLIKVNNCDKIKYIYNKV